MLQYAYKVYRMPEVVMKAKQLQKIDDLNLDLNMDLNVLNCAINSLDENLEASDLINIVERLYETSSEIRNIFDNSIP